MRLIDYIKGKRKGNEAHKIEREAMNDPFLHDALDGYHSVEGNHIDIINRLSEKVLQPEKKKKRAIYIASMAAGIAILLSVGIYMVYNELNMPDSTPNVAVTNEIPKPETNEQVEITDNIQKEDTEEEEKLERKKENLPARGQQQRNAQQETALQEEISFQDEINSETDAIADKMPERQLQQIPAAKQIPIETPAIDLKTEKSENKVTIRGSASSTTNQQPLYIVDGVAVGDISHLKAEDIESIEILKDAPASAIYGFRAAMGKDRIVSKSEKNLGAKSENSEKQKDRLIVTGKITDTEGEPLASAVVVVKGTEKVTVADENGNFRLETDGSQKLIANYIGFESKEFEADSIKPVLVALQENAQALDEVVVVGYGVSKKAALTGSVTSVSASGIVVKTDPLPKIGYRDFNKYLEENIKQPTDECADAKGRVVISFYVNPSGKPYNFKVERSICPSADKEAIRLIQEGTEWLYGNQQVRITVNFGTDS